LQLTNSPSSTQYGQSVQFTVSVTVTAPTPAIGALRSVQLWADASLLATVQPVNGEASFTVNTLTVRSHTVEARYVQDDYYNAASVTVTHQVTAGVANTVLSTDAVNEQSQYGHPLKLTAVLTAAFPLSNVVVTGSVIFKAGDIVIGSSTLNEQQTAEFITNALLVDTYSLTASFGSADNNYEAPSSNAVSHTVIKGQYTVMP